MAGKKYNASVSVIAIKTKKDSDDLEKKAVSDDPLVILDGKVSNRGEIGDLDPDNIESIEVLKGEKAIEKYNAVNGVIIFKTKKKK